MYSEKNSSRQFEIEGRTLDECRQRLHDKYGQNYQILNYETTLKGGIFGLGQREIVKAKYIVDERYDPSIPGNNIYNNSFYTPNSMNVNVNGMKKMLSQQQVVPDSFASKRDEMIKNLIGNSSVDSIKQIAQLSKAIEKVEAKIDVLSEVTTSKKEEEHPSIKKIDKILEKNEFSASFINEINAKIRNELTIEQLEDFDFVQQKVAEWIGESIAIAPKFGHKNKQAHVIIIVGPTGVGKTTTVAKMAAKIKMEAKSKASSEINSEDDSKKTRTPKNPEIKMITIDNMRVAAVEQLTHWGELMDVKVDKVENSTDLQDLFNSYKTKADYIFIDTSGYSPKDLENIAKLHSILDVDNMKPDIYLAVAASTKARDLENIIHNYEIFDFRSIIITKCDETSTYGNVLSVLHQKKKCISWITDGQQVLHSLKRPHPLIFLKSMDDIQIDTDALINKFGKEEE